MAPYEMLVHVRLTVDTVTGVVSMREEVAFGTYGPVWQFANAETAHTWLCAFDFTPDRMGVPGASGLYSDYFCVMTVVVL